MKSRPTQVIGIASGKGGVGKTTVSVNLAVALQAQGERVMLLDADLGLANAQIAFGTPCPANLSHFLAGHKSLPEIIVTTRSGVKLVPGASGMQEMAGISALQTASILQAFSELEDELDYLVVDMAAGISPSVIAFMRACPRRFIVVRDDPSSIADAYGTIKVLIQDCNVDEIYLIPNGMSSQQAGQQLHERINQVCARFLGRSVGYLGTVEQDELILSALKKHQPVLEFAPGSGGSRDFRRLADATRQLPAVERASGELQFFVERLVGQVH
ncbi:MAG: MinD/ParA family protein [Betaproteobacteria bacterium]|nr:MinD/ParA family protein [Betaproteobacteria bacterium]